MCVLCAAKDIFAPRRPLSPRMTIKARWQPLRYLVIGEMEGAAQQPHGFALRLPGFGTRCIHHR